MREAEHIRQTLRDFRGSVLGDAEGMPWAPLVRQIVEQVCL